MTVTLCRLAAGLCVTLAATAGAAAQPEVRKQKEAAEAALAKAGVEKVTTTETPGMVVFGTLPPDRAKALAESLQQVYDTSRATLKYGADQPLWPGKLTVVVLSDPKEFEAYVRQVEGRRPAEGETSLFSLRGDAPYVVIGPQPGTNPRDFDPKRDAARLMAGVVLNRRAGTGVGNGTLPDWLTGGFAEGVVARSEGDPRTVTEHRNRMRTAVLGDPARGPTGVQLADAWTGKRTAANTAVSAAFVEYLMDRVDAARFDRFLAAFRPVEGRPAPTIDAALSTLPLSRVSMETDFKVWAAQQK